MAEIEGSNMVEYLFCSVGMLYTIQRYYYIVTMTPKASPNEYCPYSRGSDWWMAFGLKAKGAHGFASQGLSSMRFEFFNSAKDG